MNIKAAELFKEFKDRGVLREMIGADAVIEGLAPVESCGARDLVFLARAEHAQKLGDRKPAAAIVSAECIELLKGRGVPLLVSDNVNLAQAWIKQKYGDRDLRNTEWPRIHPSAVIHESTRVPESVVIGPNVTIGRNVSIGENCVIMAGTVVEYDAVIGENTVIHPGVVVGYGCEIGRDCWLKSGCIIGSEGFGFAQDEHRKHHRIPQTGKVVIEDRVVIGANDTVDRAAYGVTRLKSGTIFDTLCHVAHNCEIGEDCIIVSMTGIAGSTVLGDRVICSGQTGILDHLNIPSDTILLHRAGVTQNVKASGVYAFHPLMPIGDYMKNAAVLRKIHEVKRKVGQLDKRLEGQT